MVSPFKAPGANPSVEYAIGDVGITYSDDGRTFITSGGDRTSLVTFTLPTGLVSGFRVRIGTNSKGRPARIDTGSHHTLIAFPRRSSVTATDGAAPVVSYDPNAFLDLVWDGGEDRWRVAGGSGLWISPFDSNFYDLTDVPATFRADFGQPSQATTRWTPVPSFDTLPDGGAAISVPSTQEMYDLLQPGVPIRWMYSVAGVGGGWNYGVVETFAPTGYTPDKATVTFSGVAMNSTPTVLEVGPREALRRITVTIPGTFDAAPSDYLLSGQKQFLKWAEGPAYLVRVSATCYQGDTDTGNLPNVNVRKFDMDADAWYYVLSSGIQVNTFSFSDPWSKSWVSADPSHYLITQDTPLEITTTQGGNGDASDLTVEMLFVQDRPIAFWEPDQMGGKPAINLVISGVGGFPDGVWAVTPNSYSSSYGSWYPSGTLGTKEIMYERWSFNSYMYLWLGASRHRTKPPGTAPTWTHYSTINGMSLAFYYSSTHRVIYKYTTVGRGSIMNGLMGSAVLSFPGRDVTFTWWKVGSRWNSAFA